MFLERLPPSHSSASPFSIWASEVDQVTCCWRETNVPAQRGVHRGIAQEHVIEGIGIWIEAVAMDTPKPGTHPKESLDGVKEE